MSDRALPVAQRIAERGLEVGTFLTQSVADEYLRDVLRHYANLQKFAVPSDPIDFVNAMRKFVKRRHKMSLVMPDDKTPVKFYFERWLSRRTKQIFLSHQQYVQWVSTTIQFGNSMHLHLGTGLVCLDLQAPSKRSFVVV